VGDWVVAIGNPFGLGAAVTAGIIAAQVRNIGGGPYDQFLQIDAPINMGRSGGSTFNLKGEVVGVNTTIDSPSGGSVGLGFAIPASRVEKIVTSLLRSGFASPGYLGVTVKSVNQDIADRLGLEAAAGVLIIDVEPGTPAAEAGLKTDDVITKLNAQSVKGEFEFVRQLGSAKPGEKVEISFLRDGAEKTVSGTLAALES
jgi:serine protease Do